MARSWIDFYNILTAGSQQVSQQRKDNFFKLDYSAAGAPVNRAADFGGGKKKSTNPLDGPLRWVPGFNTLGYIKDVVGGDPTTPGMRIIDVMSRLNYASANASSAIMKQQSEARSRGEVLNPNIFDPEVLKAAWEGFSGQNKKTYSKVLEEQGVDNSIARGVGGFALDVAMDPTTYIGVGALKALGKATTRGAAALGIKDINKAAEFAKDGLVPMPKAIEGVAKSGQTTAVGDKSFDAFVRDITRNPENPGQPSIFDNIIDQEGNIVEPNRVNGASNISDPRIFIADAAGNIGERLQIEGPPLDVIAARTSLGKANELARKIPKFTYNRDVLESELLKDEYGPFAYSKRRVFLDENGNEIIPEATKAAEKGGFVSADAALSSEGKLGGYAQAEVDAVREIAAKSRSAFEAAAKKAKYAHLADNKDLEELGASPLMKSIMSRVEEPVYAAYEPKTITTTTEAGRPQTYKIWVPTQEAINNKQVMDMGQIREILADKPLTREQHAALVKEMRDPATPFPRKAEIKARLDRPPVSAQKKQMAKQMLLNHVRAVEEWIRSGPAGYNDAAGYTNLYRELYGAAPKDWEKGAKGVAAARAKTAAKMDDLKPEIKAEMEASNALPDIPASPFEQPKYKDILEWDNLPPGGKKAWLQEKFGGHLSAAHMTYLAQAHNPASFWTRLRKLMLLNESEATDALDVANAIANKQLLDVEEEGVADLLKHYKVKTLPALEKAIRADLEKTDRKVGRMLGAHRKINEAVTIKQVPDQLKELGPTGQAYKAYDAPFVDKAKKAAQAAQARAAKKASQEVKPAEQIIQEVVDGNKSSLATPKVTFNSSQRAMFDYALKEAVNSEIITPKDASIYQWLTRTGVKRTSPVMNKGKGRVQDAWNLGSQYTFFKKLMADMTSVDTAVKNTLNQMGTRGADRLAARANYVYDLMMGPMRAMDDMLKAGGIFPVAGTRQYDTPLSFVDAFETLPREFIEKNIFTLVKNNSRIAPTQLMDTLNVGVAAMKDELTSPDDLNELIRLSLLEQQVTRNGKNVPNYMPALAKKRPEEFDQIVNDIIDSLPAVVERVEKNAAQRKLWHENQQFEGTQAALDAIAQRVMSPDYNIPEALALSNDVEPIIKAVSRSKGIDPNDEFMVRAEVNAGAPEFPGLNAESRAEAKRAHLRSTTKTKQGRTKIDVDAMAESRDQAAKISEDMGESLASLETRYERTLTHRLITAFFPHFGNSVIRPMFLSKSSAAQTLARTYQGLVGKISMTHTQDAINTAWKELQIGRWSADPEIHAAQVDINKAIGVMFSDDARYSLFNRQGLNADELNAHFDHYKIHPKFHFDDNETMHNAWRAWDTNDPMDLLAKMFAATQKVAGKKLLGDQLMLEFGSLTKKPGYIKIANRGNEILKYIDTDTYYFPREIASQMRVLDEFLKADMKPTYSGTGATALRIYDSALHAYKSGLTIYRPGHHVRNMVGDMWLSFMAGVTDPTVYRDALKVMRQMGGRYNDFDAVKALAAGDSVPLKAADSEAPIIYTKINGKRVGLNAGQIYRGMFDHGVLPDYRTLEDLQIGTEGAFRMPQVFGGRVHKVAATVSQSRDHYVRISHGIDVLKKGNFKSVEDAMEQASHTVRKWHPDGSDLTHFEQKVMRRTFMFYSWIRKAIPLILEGMVMRPGRAMVYPKFMYNLAAANGINLDSFSNPFPTDQLFPDYLTESMQGPFMQDSEGHYMGIQPGIPMMDVLGDYAGNEPLAQVMSSTTPVLKLPWEMAHGTDGAIATDTRTGVPIFDKSDYLDKQIPNSNLFINTTGNSLTQPWESKGGSQRDFQPDTQSAWINFLAGLGLTDMSRPGVIMQGKRDARK